MKKHRKRNKQPLKEPVLQNPVAKYARQFNKAQVFKDKTKYQRRAKHQGLESFIMSLSKGIIKGFKFFDASLFRVLVAY